MGELRVTEDLGVPERVLVRHLNLEIVGLDIRLDQVGRDRCFLH